MALEPIQLVASSLPARPIELAKNSFHGYLKHQKGWRMIKSIDYEANFLSHETLTKHDQNWKFRV